MPSINANPAIPPTAPPTTLAVFVCDDEVEGVVVVVVVVSGGDVAADINDVTTGAVETVSVVDCVVDCVVELQWVNVLLLYCTCCSPAYSMV